MPTINNLYHIYLVSPQCSLNDQQNEIFLNLILRQVTGIKSTNCITQKITIKTGVETHQLLSSTGVHFEKCEFMINNYYKFIHIINTPFLSNTTNTMHILIKFNSTTNLNTTIKWVKQRTTYNFSELIFHNPLFNSLHSCTLVLTYKNIKEKKLYI